MQRDVIIKSRSLGGTSDLTLLAPIKPGFVESLESVTYKTRIKRVLETLHGARTASEEYSSARLLSDSIERVGVIHSVRVAVLEPENKVLLAVTFDGSWESYIRVLWDKVGTLLDLIFCGTVDYVTAFDHTFDQWMEWAHRVQIETGFFYGPPHATARDVLYLRRLGRMQVRGGGAEVNEIRTVLPSAEVAMQRLLSTKPHPDFERYEDEPFIERGIARRMLHEQVRVGLQGLASMYRLADLHRPSTSDGEILRRATLDLLLEFVQLHDGGAIKVQLGEARASRFGRQLDWLFPPPDDTDALLSRPTPATGDYPKLEARLRSDIQGGILRSYGKVTHGLMLMLAFDDAAAAAHFFSWIESPDHRITNDMDPPEAEAGRVFRNIGLTPAGLRAVGLEEDTLELFPEEFRQGMAARAGSIGDVHENHPRRWRLPRRLVRDDFSPADQPIELGTVHAVLQLRCLAEGVAAIELSDPAHPLRKEVQQLRDENPHLRLLAVQPMARRYSEANPGEAEDHFGYADGLGQPDIEIPAGPVRRNRIPLGEIILGHMNSVEWAAEESDPGLSQAARDRIGWLENGTFLVVRKYRQYAFRLEQTVAATARALELELRTNDDLSELVYAKLVGRWRNGNPLITPVGQDNNFLYDDDPQGQQCPLHAHIRLAHPRMEKGSPGARLPRLMRRGMSYGPPHVPGKDDDAADRGVVFMAYNASIGEQYEVVQRWLTGGNSTGSSSGQSCPIVGVPENGIPRYFRFEHPGATGEPQVFRALLEERTPLFEEPRMLSRLEWGLYLFTPGLTVLRRLRAAAAAAAAAAPAAVSEPWQIARGRILIATLQQVQVEHGGCAAGQAWKSAIEDPDSIDRLDSAAIWAAIRGDHDGVLKTPYGTLVASRELISQVLLDPHERYSISGQLERMKRSIGETYLGLDPGRRYHEESEQINRTIGKLADSAAGREYVFNLAQCAAANRLIEIVEEARRHSREAEDERFEVSFDARELVDEVLADLCESWFGIQGSVHFRRGGSDWAWTEGQPPLYPGHFTALSRYMFQPHPGQVPAELGVRYGQALRIAMGRFVAEHRAAGTTPQAKDGFDAPIALEIFNHPVYGSDDDWVARTMIGVMMGFIAPIIGAVLNVLREWRRDSTFDLLRAELSGRTDHASAAEVLLKPMNAGLRMRPMPQILWRNVRKPHRLELPAGAEIELAAGEKMVLGLVSATQQSLADGLYDGNAMFGGVRDGANPHPTHACPGYDAGIAAMVGALTALLSWSGRMRQGSAPLTFVLDGDSGYVPDARLHPDDYFWESFDFTTAKLPGSTGLIVGWGDSWLDASIVGRIDLKDWLREFGYEVNDDFCNFRKWGTLRQMAFKADEFCASLKELMDGKKTPRAILLSGGGNDSTGDDLRKVLNKEGTLPLLNGFAADQHVANLQAHYRTILGKIGVVEKSLKDGGRPEIPVIVHGYDYPMPKARRFGNYDVGYLRCPLLDSGCDTTTDDGRKAARKAMHDLIFKLNTMLSRLPEEFPFVRYADLREVIEGDPRWAGDPWKGWFDDLHPLSEAFHVLALKIDETIKLPVA